MNRGVEDFVKNINEKIYYSSKWTTHSEREKETDGYQHFPLFGPLIIFFCIFLFDFVVLKKRIYPKKYPLFLILIYRENISRITFVCFLNQTQTLFQKYVIWLMCFVGFWSYHPEDFTYPILTKDGIMLYFKTILDHWEQCTWILHPI